MHIFATSNGKYRLNQNGAIAQLVEQRTENPCVPGSIPGGTTVNERVAEMWLSFLLCNKGLKLLENWVRFSKKFYPKWQQ